MITPLPGAWPCVPGSATLPFFGVLPVILDDKVRPLNAKHRGLWYMKSDCARWTLLKQVGMHD
jgi:acetyl-CoA synthetase